MPVFRIVLNKAYYKQGFFNVKVDYDRYIDKAEGPIKIQLNDGRIIGAKINRSANTNGTARIMGGTELRNFFHSKFKEGDTVDMDIISPDYIQIL